MVLRVSIRLVETQYPAAAVVVVAAAVSQFVTST
jgi:hypothetical protein